MSTHGVEKFGGFPINYRVTINAQTKDSNGVAIAWPYILTVMLFPKNETNIFESQQAQLVLEPGAWSITSESPGFKPLTTPNVEGEWDVGARLEAAASDNNANPIPNANVFLDEKRHSHAVRSLEAARPADSGTIQVPNASAIVKVGVFSPPIPTSHPDPFNASWTETREDTAASFPDGFWSYRVQLNLSGRIQNRRNINVQFFWRDHNGEQIIPPVVARIPPPSSQGFEWWNWYSVASWNSNLAPARYQVELVVFEDGAGKYGRRTVWFDML